MLSVSREKVLGAFGVVGVGVLLAGPAFGCTVFRGQITANGNGAGSASGTMHGALRDMDWCENSTTFVKTVKVKTGTSTLTYSTGPTSGGLVDTGSTNPSPGTGCPVPGLRDGNYQAKVTVPQATYMPPGGGSGIDHNCHSTNGIVIAAGTVSNGDGVFRVVGQGQPVVSAWATTPTSGTVTKSSLCVFNVDDPVGTTKPQNSIDAIDILFDEFNV